MKLRNIGNAPNIPAFVRRKLEAFTASAQDFRALYGFMFSEADNVLFERSVGYRIEQITYGACKARLEKRAAALKGLLGDLPADSPVGLYMENGPDWIELFWAILLCGYRPLLMNLRLGRETLEDVLRSAEVKAVVSDGMTFRAARTLAASDIPEAEAPIAEGPTGTELLVMSSGTSAHVKLCAYSAREVASQIRDSCGIVRRCKAIQRHWQGELKLLTFLPFYHIFGLIAVYMWFGFFSRTFVLLNDYAPQTILDTIRRHRVTHIFAVPLLWEKTYDEAMRAIRERGGDTLRRFEKGLKLAPKLPAWARRRLFREVRENLYGESVQFCITGGGLIRPETLRFFNGIGYWLSNGYGMTETGVTSVELSRSAATRASGSVGQPLSAVRYRIRDGILEVKGESTARRILTDGAWRERGDDWFSTGDLAEERDGRFWLLGRSDDLVIGADGENLNPEQIEPRLCVPGCREVALIGGGDLQPTLLACVPGWLSRAQADAVRNQIAEAAAPVLLRVVLTADPLTEPGDFKLSRAKIRERFRRGEIRPLAPRDDSGDADDPVLERVRALMAVSLGRDEADVPAAADYFSDLGGSSLDYYAFAAALEEELGAALPRESGLLRTAEAVAQYVREARRHGNLAV